VVGHLGEQIRSAVGRWFPGLAVEFVANPAFAATGTAASLALARPVVDGEAFVLCDGDVVFAPAAIDRLFAAGARRGGGAVGRRPRRRGGQGGGRRRRPGGSDRARPAGARRAG
jgi:choline kinase